MFSFDNSFLEQVGLSSMPEEQKASFLEYAQEQFEDRIGEKMYALLSDAQLTEFEGITDNNPDIMAQVVNRFGNYREDELFQKVSKLDGMSESEALNKYITMRWLNENCPQYQQIIENSMDDLKSEIKSQSNAFLGA